ncbi:MAG TPA: YkvA family protein [Polyangiaceae bacterium]|nr:YkvA family protein [Polyangiaceae bacterium]
MSDVDSRCLDAFPDFLRSLADDAGVLSAVVEDSGLSEDARRHAAGALSYLFKSLDLIPDGIEELGYLDDAFVFRVAARLATHVEPVVALEKLAHEAELVSDFLSVDYPRLERFVAGLGKLTVRGRSVDEVLASPEAAASFTGEVRGWAKDYAVPPFGRDVKNLVKLRSFLRAKLPA